MLKLKLQYFGHLQYFDHQWRTDSLKKTFDARKDWRQEKGMTEDEMVGWHHRLDGHGLSKLWELVMDREAWRTTVYGVSKNWTQLSDWTECKLLNLYICLYYISQILHDNINFLFI